ncbi:potassium transporter Kup [Acidiphilium sp. AL]|uniref:Probable potassium transport system protein Kup n=1 Tax=Acidiphilium iwatense TaxID=768198 RepID=A0ABS9DRJ0_9PROT|nr:MULTISPECIES: potassium transporter Kup [Acidiphilium]MCF3945368.1 potassium transporter Kup [Acidiphilium iwatense]MCU4158884.1 potassium transporter Kup [Acidiphilium sp. AL]
MSEASSSETSSIATSQTEKLKLAALVGVLGVVYGDIGTSPLYSLQACLGYVTKGGLKTIDVLGLLSLIFWALIVTVTLKYVTFVMRADNNGEGGVLALMALAQRVARTSRTRYVLMLVGIVGAGLFLGDGVITPAISVLSAVEGLGVASPAFNRLVLPIAVAVIVGLFLVQRRGTGAVGKLFGPIMTVWFITIGGFGLYRIVLDPKVLRALVPSYGIHFIVRHEFLAFIALGAVVLAVTGAEALYADMSHFGRRPIRLTWMFFVLPALVLNYFGQGALVIADPKAASNPFYLTMPHALLIPMVILSTIATIIASQSVISGAFTVGSQCVQLGLLPRMEVRHTSLTEEGQIYVPQMNIALAIGVLVLVLGFRSSNALASAYGIAVTGTFLCTNILAALVFHRHFNWSRWKTILIWGAFFTIDAAFFSANILKIVEGGWVPLAIGLSIVVLMTTWRRGRGLLFARWQQDSLPLASFLGRLPQSRIVRVPGIAVFLTGNPEYTPASLLHNLKHNKVLHETVFFVTVRNLDVPIAAPEDRIRCEELASGIYRVGIGYGFMDSPNLPRSLELLREQGLPFNPMQTSYFLGRETVVPAMVPKLGLIRRTIFLFMLRNAISATEFFQIPSDRVVELGVRVAI